MAAEVDVLTETVDPPSGGRGGGYAGDPGNAAEWYVNIAVVKWLTPPPVRGRQPHGLRRRVPRPPARLHLRGGRARARPRLVMRTADGPFPMETTYTWEPTRRAARPG